MKKLFILALLLLPQLIIAQKIEIISTGNNSEFDDFAPALTQNSRYMYFTSDRDNGRNQKIYVSERTSDGWDSPNELNDEINNGVQIGSVSLTPDGQKMVFAAYNHELPSNGRTDLYFAYKIDGDWIDIENLGSDVNSNEWDSQPTISADGNTIYFASDREGGFGGSDIYVTYFRNNKWTKPENLGSTVNTAANEMSPIIAIDNKSLYFASDRTGGEGGFDIYFTKKMSSDNFQRVTNIGSPLNSSADEFFYSPKPNSNIAYFSSSRSGGEGNLDNYMAVPNPYPSDAVVLVTGVVTDAESGDPLGSKITITDLTTGKKVAEMHSDDQNGEYVAVLQPGANYSITAQKDGYLFYSDRFDIPPTNDGYEKQKNIELDPVTGGRVRLLIFFDFDKANLKDESTPELERVVDFMRANSGVVIKLVGHTDDQGADDYNKKLSKDRANSVKNYLVHAGINKDRIQADGKGESEPLINETTEEARAQNRRVEMLIIK